MIVSHRHRFIFFAVPRTGTHAIRTALGPVLGDDDWQQQSLTAEVRMPVAALARFNHGHLTLRQVQASLPSTVWRDYFKFAFVRNPYDRFVSVCAMLNKRNPGYRGGETAFMKRALTVPRFRQRVLVRPQVDMLLDEAGRLGMDCVGRYETLDESFAAICGQIGIAERGLERSNTTDHDAFGSYYDDELVAAVTAFYRRDFEVFGYETT
ncbi:MAG: sulfotransferase family 2 domain-containing protein [Gammaproteobacteria bacterium]|nr:sulfotransferase family 2 domain-containing protein [Gammaproteobacteria bacterium]